MRVALSLVVAVAACATLPAELREHTYPRELQYITRGELRSAMGDLARGVAGMDAALSAPDVDEAARSAVVVAQLQDMQRAARTIDPAAARSSHPDLERSMSRFMADLRAAEDGARAVPPRYYLAGTIVGACASCHAPNR